MLRNFTNCNLLREMCAERIRIPASAIHSAQILQSYTAAQKQNSERLRGLSNYFNIFQNEQLHPKKGDV